MIDHPGNISVSLSIKAEKLAWSRSMGIFSDVDKKLTDNLYAHGNDLIDPAADLPEKVEERVELLMPFVQPEARELVRSQILGLIHEYRNEDPARAS
ncbi:hypothetical protein [Mesorhizobium sp.]|uniref:hypothetical protein n=1 Tax=Mesorhizobium sp. TaxID=1871066 RepID=UPI0025DF20B8|nr:hypothetical protein [Mesorhizobium sp.]